MRKTKYFAECQMFVPQSFKCLDKPQLESTEEVLPYYSNWWSYFHSFLLLSLQMIYAPLLTENSYCRPASMSRHIILISLRTWAKSSHAVNTLYICLSVPMCASGLESILDRRLQTLMCIKRSRPACSRHAAPDVCVCVCEKKLTTLMNAVQMSPLGAV